MKEQVFNKKVSIIMVTIWLISLTAMVFYNIDWSNEGELEMKHDLFCTWSDICEASSFSENPIEATIMITSDFSSIIMFIYLLSYLLIGIDEEEYKNWKSEREATKKKNATCENCGAKMFKSGLLVKKYHCHTCCQTCGGADRNRFVAFDFEVAKNLKPCTCPIHVTKCSNCGEINCAGCDF